MNRPTRRSRWGVPWLTLPLGALLAWVAAAQTLLERRPDSTETQAPFVEPLAAAIPVGPPPGLPPAGRPADLVGQLRIGENLGSLFTRRLGLDAAASQAAAESSARYVDLRQLRAGSIWRAYLTDQGELERFELAVEGKGELAVVRAGVGWQPHFATYRKESRLRTVVGRLEGSLEESILAAGATSELAWEMAEVLQWDLDFSRDLQRGDEFRLLYEEIRIERSEPAIGRVHAIDYRRADGRQLSAFWFGEGSSAGYYDAEGRPLAKMFLRSPIPYSRISSRFSNRRLHPVLGVFRPHHGVDYAAPTGTPVRATAGGTVVSVGWAGGGGKTVKVRHPNGYLTAYLHLSKYADGMRVGRSVAQGAVVGYVGATGLATAPHLDYRIQKDGRWIDPLALPTVAAQPIAPHELADFRSVRDAMRQAIATGSTYEPPAFLVARQAGQRAGGGAPATSSNGSGAGAT